MLSRDVGICGYHSRLHRRLSRLPGQPIGAVLETPSRPFASDRNRGPE